MDFEKGPGFARSRPAKWQTLTPVRTKALVLAGDRLFAAGVPDVVPTGDPYAALEGRRGGVLQVFSGSDGRLLATQPLASPPLFDGMAAANGRLYLATADRHIVCLGRPATRRRSGVTGSRSQPAGNPLQPLTDCHTLSECTHLPGRHR